jgi:hypothetical protein
MHDFSRSPNIQIDSSDLLLAAWGGTGVGAGVSANARALVNSSVPSAVERIRIGFLNTGIIDCFASARYLS